MIRSYMSRRPTIIRAAVRAAALIAMAIVGIAQAPAQSFPSKPITLVVGFAAGGIADLVARLLAEHITRETGQTVVVDNRTGAAGTIAMTAVAKAPPDGHTLGVVLVGNLAINPFVQKDMPIDVLKALAPVAAIGDAPQMLAVPADLPAKTLQEFLALAKSKPGSLNYGSAGHGSLPHLSVALFARLAGIELVHVPYRGMAPATTDLMAGRVQLISSSISGLQPGIDAGKIRVIAVATKERLPYMPDVPTAGEAGVPGYVVGVWSGVVAPAGTPPEILDRIHGLVAKMLADPVARKRMDGWGIVPMPMSRAEFASFVRAEYARWGETVRAAGVEPQ